MSRKPRKSKWTNLKLFSSVLFNTALNSKGARGGVKLEFVRNSFDSIRKFTIRLIRKGKKSSKNSINFNSKFVRFERKKFERFANFSNSVFWFEKFEILFLSNSILCCLILSYAYKGTLFWWYINNHYVHLQLICGWPISKYSAYIGSIRKNRYQFDLNSIRKIRKLFGLSIWN